MLSPEKYQLNLYKDKERPIVEAPYTSRDFVDLIAGFVSDKKGFDIVILDMRDIANFCDYFVICSANTDRHVKAIADGIEQGLRDLGYKAKVGRGKGKTEWIVYDAGDVVTHIFQKQVREFYNLEYLWQEAKKIEFKEQI